MTLTAGQVLQSRYRVISLLAQGGFGAVYQGWDDNLGKLIAIKENLDTSPEAQRQFQHEASILSNLSHPNLPRVTDHFFIGGWGQYLMMDFVEGEDLQTMLDRMQRPLPEVQVLAWIDQVCDALEYLHAQHPPVIHRDIKPANIRITPQGRAVLVDFGISKIYDPTLKTTLGARAVTPPYSPPEQYGQGITDPRSDIYALGATLYTLLTGQEPPESVDRVSNGLPLMPPRQWVPTLSPQIDAAIMRACEVNRTQRYQSARELRQALTAYLRAPNVQPVAQNLRSLPVPRSVRLSRRLNLFLSMGLAVFGMVVIIGIILVGQQASRLEIAGQNQAIQATNTAIAKLAQVVPTESTTTQRPTREPTVATSPALVASLTPAPLFEGDPEVIGQSVQGRPIVVYRLGAGPIKHALIGAIHGGYEWNTADLMTKTLAYLRDNPALIPTDLTLYILPIANPDGYATGTDQIGGRLNADGVDLNSNWDYHWQITGYIWHASGLNGYRTFLRTRNCRDA